MQDEEVVFGLGYPYTDDGVGGAPRFMEMMLQKLLNDMEYQKVTKVPETEPVSDIIFYLNDEEKAKLSTLCTLKAYGEGVFLEYVGGAVKYEEDKIKAVVEAMPYVAPIIANNMIVPELEEIIVSMNVVFGINEKGILSDEIVQERISQSSKDKWFVLEESLHDELLHSLAQAEKGELFVGKIKGESVYCCFFDRYAIMGCDEQVYYYVQGEDTIPIAMQCDKAYEVNETERTIADGQGIYTFDFLNMTITEESRYEVVYTWDNSVEDASAKHGMLVEDWNHDGKDDCLIIETEELEGSEVIKKFELTMSDCDSTYILEGLDYYFIDIISGNFDSDNDTEILLLFDTRYAGAEGCLGIQLLDFDGEKYANLVEDFFSGSKYTVKVKAGNNGGYLICKSNGEEVKIAKDYVYESAIGMVTGFYVLDVLENEGTNYIKIKQYVAGEDMTDHVGDMVSIWGIIDEKLTLVYEEVEADSEIEDTSL
ncbi:MAG: hypothetical protein IJ326_05455 [Lachnospiraceae bacterium]|nr:hypothetical protein [Lachnospiraceae bacterium]